MKKIILYIFIIIIYTLLLSYVNLTISNIYKNPIFKFMFLFLLYFYGKYDIGLTLLLAILYINLDQEIKKKELLYNI